MQSFNFGAHWQLIAGIAVLVVSASAGQPTPSFAADAAFLRVPRPAPWDTDTITKIAEIGPKEFVALQSGSDVESLIEKRCGTPWPGTKVHPSYLAALLADNPKLKQASLSSLPDSLTVKLPACAPFAVTTVSASDSKGFERLARSFNTPFNTNVFEQVVALSASDPKGFERIARSLNTRSSTNVFEPAIAVGANRNSLATASSTSAALERLNRQTCNIPTSNASVGDVTRYFGCVNALSTAVLNENVKNAHVWSGEVKIPVSGAESPQSIFATARLFLPDAEDVERARDSSSVIPGSGIEPEVKLLSALPDPKLYGPSCSEAHNAKKGAWPFDKEALLRVLRLSKMVAPHERNKVKIAVVDSGFDFARDPNVDQAEPKIRPSGGANVTFPDANLFRADARGDTPVLDDNLDSIPGNDGYAGVNVSGRTGKYRTHASGRTNPAFKERSHGLMVATLSLGGRDLETVRWLVPELQSIQLTFVNVVPLTLPPVIDRGAFTAATIYASKGRPGVMNVSMASSGRLGSVQSELEEVGQGLVVVAAAGNNDSPDPRPVLLDERPIWPAAFGGKELPFPSQNEGVLITVGAHDADFMPAKFTYYSPKSVDLLAPGCMIPTYDQREVDGAQDLVPTFATGTSFAAPLVAFVAGVMRSLDFEDRPPAWVKLRLISTVDYVPAVDEQRRSYTLSSGVLNVGKALAIHTDVLEVGQGSGKRIRYGKVSGLPNQIDCDANTVPLAEVRKIASGGVGNPSLVISSKSRQSMTDFAVRKCSNNPLSGKRLRIVDAETGDDIEISGDEVLDFVPR